MSRRRFAFLLACAGTAAALCLGITAARQALSPLMLARDFLRNPFGLSSRAAPSGPVVLQEVQRLQRLETCRYNGEVIVQGDTSGWLPVWLAGDKVLFVGRGEVVAGVDLGHLKPDDIRVRGGEVAVRLPKPEILHSRLDNRGSEVYERRSGVLTGPDLHLETRVRVEAEDRIRQAAMESGLLATADTNARDTLRRHLTSLGFREVRFL
jgi:hypothetical protein